MEDHSRRDLEKKGFDIAFIRDIPLIIICAFLLVLIWVSTDDGNGRTFWIAE
jgi:uncharacterized membrane protein